MTGRRAARALAAGATLMVTAGLVLPANPVAAAAGPCVLSVTADRIAHHRLANRVVVDRFTVTVTNGSRAQHATVERLLMPKGSTPQLVAEPLGQLRPLVEQLKPLPTGLVAAVNGDFFGDYSTGRGQVELPLGASVSRGAVVRASSSPLRVVGVDTSGRPYGGTLATSGTVSAASTTWSLTSVNWHALGRNGVGLYTTRWSDSASAPRPAGSVEWVVQRGKVVEVRTGRTRGAPVAAGTRVVAFGANHAASSRAVPPGTRVSLTVTQTTSSGTPLAEAVGRGRTLVQRAAPVLACSSTTLEARPRTTVGWLKGGRWAAMSVLGSGYDSSGYRYGGLGLAQEANLAVTLGFGSAFELDGGGSTAAYVRRRDASWHRVDDIDSRWARMIPNGLAFTAS